MKRILLTMLLGAPMVANSANFYEAPAKAKKQEVAVQSTIKDLRPAPEKRLFRSEAVEKQILDLKSKLTAIDPETLAQASRIPGVSPSDINVLLVLMGR